MDGTETHFENETRSSIAEEADEWIQSEEEEELDQELASIAEETDEWI